MKKRNLFLLLPFLAWTAVAQTITWQPEQASNQLIGQQVSILEDPTHQSTLEQVASDSFQRRFTPYKQKILNTLVSESHFWVRFTLDNPTREALLLEVSQPLMDTISLSFKDTAGQWQTEWGGFHIPLYQKKIKHHYHLFHLPQGKTILYFRFKGNSSPVPLSLWSEEAHEIKTIHQQLLFGIYMGIMSFVILTNIFWYFSLGWVSNLYYAFFVFCYAVFSGIYEGYILHLFPNLDLVKWYFLDSTFNTANGVLYSAFFLEAPKYAPRLWRNAFILGAYFISFNFWHPLLSPPMATIILQNQGLISILFICYTSYTIYKKGNLLGIYVLWTYLLFFLIATMEVLYDIFGTPTYLFNISYISIAILVEVFSLAYLLSKRLEWENTAKELAKEQAQTQLLMQTRENERILANQNEILEKQVNERTLELKDSLAIIQEQSDRLTILMKELHHRVKNNLQIVSSLLNIQSYGVKDAEAVKALQESKHRVDAMSLIHQHLYQTDDTGYLDIQAYTTNICETLMQAYGYSYRNFELKVDVPQLYFDIDKAIPIGLILNELVTNSFKYAYKNVQKPSLSVVLTAALPYTLHVMDNGKTFTKIDWERKTMSFGKQLISSLTHQINGKLSLDTESGTHFKIILATIN